MRNIKYYLDQANQILDEKVPFTEWDLGNGAKKAGGSLIKTVLIYNQINVNAGASIIKPISREAKVSKMASLISQIERDILNEETATQKFHSIFASEVISSFCEFLKNSALNKQLITDESYKNWLVKQMNIAQDMNLEQDNAICDKDIIELIKLVPQYAKDIIGHDLVVDAFSSHETASIALRVIIHNIKTMTMGTFKILLEHMSFEYSDDEGEDVFINPIDFIVTELDGEYEKEFLPYLVSNRNLDLSDIQAAKKFLESFGDEEDSGVGSASASPELAYEGILYTVSADPRKRNACDEEEADHHRGFKEARKSYQPTTYIGGSQDTDLFPEAEGPQDLDLLGIDDLL
jgi:hypothetical protein